MLGKTPSNTHRPYAEPSRPAPCRAVPQPRCPRSLCPSPIAPPDWTPEAAHHGGPARRLGGGGVTQGGEEPAGPEHRLSCLALPYPAPRGPATPRTSPLRGSQFPCMRCSGPASFPRSSLVCVSPSLLAAIPSVLHASLGMRSFSRLRAPLAILTSPP